MEILTRLQNDTSFLESLGVTDLADTIQQDLLVEVGETIFLGVMHRVRQVLDLGAQERLAVLLDESAADPENVQKREGIDTFLKEKVYDLERFITEEVESFRRTQEQIYGEITS